MGYPQSVMATQETSLQPWPDTIRWVIAAGRVGGILPVALESHISEATLRVLVELRS